MLLLSMKHPHPPCLPSHRVREDLEQHQHLHFSPHKENVSSSQPDPPDTMQVPTSQKRKAHEVCIPNNSQLLQMRNPCSAITIPAHTHNSALFHKTNSIKQPSTTSSECAANGKYLTSQRFIPYWHRMPSLLYPHHCPPPVFRLVLFAPA